MSALIRPANPADAALVFALVVELAKYERLESEVDATRETLAAALFCRDPRAFCDIAEHQGEAVGMSVWFYSFSTFRGRHGIWIEDLFVRPAFRGQGFGKELIASLARRCAAEKLARLEWSVLDWNEPSIAFYERLGARRMEQWTNCRLEGEALSRLGRTAPLRR
ncbi:GNAT family N-acetyltransferase [Methylocapsa polymorpha]|uniref:GNAT family N-acetyltransferase n=1 Tax=Methylocapsa polymorpha TaxID=3080828 RepID=A0ABZ0HTI0_9HYPH|nr:GNAT family N-acetyltransferase [Methylocapsa sp. RX1]